MLHFVFIFYYTQGFRMYAFNLLSRIKKFIYCETTFSLYLLGIYETEISTISLVYKIF